MSFRFTTIDEPNAAQGLNQGTELYGISSKTGVIVGDYVPAVGSGAGFTDFLGNFTTLLPAPGTGVYVAIGVNDFANVVGVTVDAVLGDRGYLNVGNGYILLDDPSAAQGTIATAINDSGRIVGYYMDGLQVEHAFTYSGGANGTFSDVLIPGAMHSAAIGINASGEISGYYSDAGFKIHGFLKINNSVVTLDVPGATGTMATGVNDNGQVVGTCLDGKGQDHGFLYSGGVYATFDNPKSASGQILAWGISNSGLITGTYQDSPGHNHGFVASRSTPHDLYNVGTAGVLWRGGSGLASWDMNGSSIFSSATVTYQGQALNPDASWKVTGMADFNADGAADVLWHQDGGSLAVWQMSGSTVKASNSVTYSGSVIAPDASWSVAGAADFNADSEADILWRQSSGSLAMWSMDGSTVRSSNTVTYNGSAIAPDASWTIAGIADFNGDGYSDVLWRQSSGALALWDMKGSTVMSSSTVTSQGSAIAPDASWSIAGVGDFNSDGRADMLWRQSAGALALWQMNDASVAGSAFITYQGNTITPDATWKIVEVGDFNGDGNSDILWRNDNGSMAEWLMNGSQVTASVTPASQGNAVAPDASWSVQGKPTMFA
jgi:probable HAF family extracellular repeat protein